MKTAYGLYHTSDLPKIIQGCVLLDVTLFGENLLFSE